LTFTKAKLTTNPGIHPSGTHIHSLIKKKKSKERLNIKDSTQGGKMETQFFSLLMACTSPSKM
jgi:hypothetical protein